MNHSISIRCGNREYVWNREKAKVKEITVRLLDIGDCPKEVVNEIVLELNEEVKNIDVPENKFLTQSELEVLTKALNNAYG
jgi:hypothetical protein